MLSKRRCLNKEITCFPDLKSTLANLKKMQEIKITHNLAIEKPSQACPSPLSNANMHSYLELHGQTRSMPDMYGFLDRFFPPDIMMYTFPPSVLLNNFQNHDS